MVTMEGSRELRAFEGAKRVFEEGERVSEGPGRTSEGRGVHGAVVGQVSTPRYIAK